MAAVPEGDQLDIFVLESRGDSSGLLDEKGSESLRAKGKGRRAGQTIWSPGDGSSISASPSTLHPTAKSMEDRCGSAARELGCIKSVGDS